MPYSLNRRRTLQLLGYQASLAFTLAVRGAPALADNTNKPLRDRIHGLLIGSLIGDAAGGPVEFKSDEERRKWLPDARVWPDSRTLSDEELAKLSRDLPLLPYKGIRSEPASYGPWAADAPAGTITDDSRHKIILLHTLAKLRGTRKSLTAKDLAQGFLDYRNSPGVTNNEGYQQLYDDGFQEFNYAARWLLGERDPRLAKPVSRLWGGVGTCCGQMCLPPLAALYPGDPEGAYRAAYALGFIDQGSGKDMNAALIAGLAVAINDQTIDPHVRWQNALSAIQNTDPFRFQDVRFMSRELNKWLDFAKSAAERAEGKPKQLYAILEQEGRPVYWWDAHFIIVSAFSLLYLCRFQPLAAMHLSLDFGHDTDSVAQMIGGFAGAVHGTEVFPASFRDIVTQRLKSEYHEDINEWVDLLVDLSDRSRYPQPIRME